MTYYIKQDRKMCQTMLEVLSTENSRQVWKNIVFNKKNKTNDPMYNIQIIQFSNGTRPGVRRNKRPLFAYNRRKCFMVTY